VVRAHGEIIPIAQGPGCDSFSTTAEEVRAVSKGVDDGRKTTSMRVEALALRSARTVLSSTVCKSVCVRLPRFESLTHHAAQTARDQH
jgi:hypothetical protein